jgi:arylsulfatase A-like enzyme
VLGGVALAAACSPGPQPMQAVRAPNIVLISIDSLRADHLGCYGYGRETSPAIDALAREGVLFENAVAQAPWTLPSHASLLTSLYARTHQATDAKLRLPAEPATLAGELREAGYSTRAVVGGTFMQARFGLDRGFDVYDDTQARVSHQRSHAAVTSPTTHERALELLNGAPEPFFLFVHYWDVHYDYLPPPPYDTKFDPDYAGSVSAQSFMKNEAIHAGMDPRDLAHIVALYDGEIAWVDHHIDLLLDALSRRGLDERTIVVLTADHGDEFFEHGEKGHMHSLYQELLHVPLLVRLPGLVAGRRVTERVELIDVMPTLLEAAGRPVPDGLHGRSLLPLVQGGTRLARPAFAETTKARKSKHAEEEKLEAWCVYDGAHKLITFTEDRHPPELYDLDADPAEQANLVGRLAADPLREQLHTWRERVTSGAAVENEGVDEDTMRTLRSLGYVGNE